MFELLVSLNYYKVYIIELYLIPSVTTKCDLRLYLGVTPEVLLIEKKLLIFRAPLLTLVLTVLSKIQRYASFVSHGFICSLIYVLLLRLKFSYFILHLILFLHKKFLIVKVQMERYRYIGKSDVKYCLMLLKRNFH